MNSKRRRDRAQTLYSAFVLVALFVTFPTGLVVHAGAQSTAERDLLDGRMDTAIASLKATLVATPRDAAAHLLLCRVFYATANADGAIAQCEAALANGDAGHSDAQDWMGRAYGMKAEHAGMMSGFSLARKVRSAFEQAVQLDPHSAAAVNDLSEYYIAAPGIVGGGIDKASALAARELTMLPQSAHRTRALIAQKQGNAAGAEKEFRAAAEVSNEPGAWLDLGHFFAEHKNADASLVALHHAIDADTAKDSVLVDVASVLISQHREPELAERLLRLYLASAAKSDAAPAFQVHTQLGQLLLAHGDKLAARHEFEAALALFSQYAPARNALASLAGQKG